MLQYHRGESYLFDNVLISSNCFWKGFKKPKKEIPCLTLVYAFMYFCRTSGLIMQTHCSAQSASANKKFPFRHRFSSCLTMHRAMRLLRKYRDAFICVYGFTNPHDVANVDGELRIVYSFTKSDSFSILKSFSRFVSQKTSMA